MIIAILDMILPPGHEADTIRALRAFRDSTTALPGCIGGGVFQEFGSSEAALYVEMWQEEVPLEAHIRSRGYERLLAIMETSAQRPALHFSFVREMRGLRWVEQLRLGSRSAG